MFPNVNALRASGFRKWIFRAHALQKAVHSDFSSAGSRADGTVTGGDEAAGMHGKPILHGENLVPRRVQMMHQFDRSA